MEARRSGNTEEAVTKMNENEVRRRLAPLRRSRTMDDRSVFALAFLLLASVAMAVLSATAMLSVIARFGGTVGWYDLSDGVRAAVLLTVAGCIVFVGASMTRR